MVGGSGGTQRNQAEWRPRLESTQKAKGAGKRRVGTRHCASLLFFTTQVRMYSEGSIDVEVRVLPEGRYAAAAMNIAALMLGLAVAFRHGGEGVWAGRGPIEWRAPVLPPLLTWKGAALEGVEGGVKYPKQPQMPRKGEIAGEWCAQSLSNPLEGGIQERRKEQMVRKCFLEQELEFRRNLEDVEGELRKILLAFQWPRKSLAPISNFDMWQALEYATKKKRWSLKKETASAILTYLEQMAKEEERRAAYYWAEKHKCYRPYVDRAMEYDLHGPYSEPWKMTICR